MKKDILIAVDSSIHSRKALRYVSTMSSIIKELRYTLFHVQPTISEYLIDEAEKDVVAKAKLGELIRKNSSKAKDLLNDLKKEMVELGVEETAIKTVTQPKLSELAKDIMDYSQANQYDATVVGRRGISKIHEMIMGSVTHKLIEHSQVIPVWVVDDKVESSKIMLAVDGSESSYRAVDHLSFMLKDNTDIEITLLHIKPRFGDFVEVDFDEEDKELGEIMIRGEKHQIENFFGHAKKKFEEAGISKEQFHFLDLDCHVNVGKTIVKEIVKGHYGTLVIGRSGVSKAFFFGSVSKYVLENASNCAIWLVP